MTRPIRRRIEGITTAEFEQLDDVTAGTVAASKVVIVDASKDATGFNNLGGESLAFNSIDVGADGAAGTLDIFPTTASKGKVTITATDNSGDTTTTINIAAQSGARSYSVPDFGVTGAEFNLVKKVDVTITSAQLLALNATPISVVTAAGSGFGIVPLDIVLGHAGGTAYAGIAGGEDLVLKYTNAAGAACSQQIETIGFLDQVGAQTRYITPLEANITPVDNAAIVLHLLTGEITTGDFDLDLTIYYKVIPIAS